MCSIHRMITLCVFKTMPAIRAIRKLKDFEYKNALKQKNARRVTLIMKKHLFSSLESRKFVETGTILPTSAASNRRKEYRERNFIE